MPEPSLAEKLMMAYDTLEERDRQGLATAASAAPQHGRTASTMPFGGSSSGAEAPSPDDMDVDQGAAQSRRTASHTFDSARTFVATPSKPDRTWLGSLLAEGMMAQLERGHGLSAGEVPFPASSAAPISESSMDQINLLQHKLNQRLGPEYVESRRGSGGMNVSYIEGWKAIDLANEVFGFNGWSTAIRKLEIDFCDVSEDAKIRISATCIMRITLRDGTYHEDVGCGMMEGGTSKGQAVQKCKKEAVTDAIKRTLKTFGRLMGNCLYDSKFREQIKKMKAVPPKFDLNDLKRGPDPIAVQGYKEAKAKHDAALENLGRDDFSKAQQNSMQRAAAPRSAPTKPAPGTATRSSNMGPPPAPLSAVAPSTSTIASSEGVEPMSRLALRSMTTPASGPAKDAANDKLERERMERLRLAAQRKEELQRRRQGEAVAAAAAATEAAAAARPRTGAPPARAQTAAARLAPGAPGAAGATAAPQVPSASPQFNDVDEALLSGAMEEYEAQSSKTTAASYNETMREPNSDDSVQDGLNDDDGAAFAMLLEQQAEDDTRKREEQEAAANRQRNEAEGHDDSAIALSDTSVAEVKKEYVEGVPDPQPPRRAGSKGRFNNYDAAARASTAAYHGISSGATSLSAIATRRNGCALGTAQRTSPRTERAASLKRSATSVENIAQANESASAQGQPIGHDFMSAVATAAARAKVAPYPAPGARPTRQQLSTIDQPVDDATAKRPRYS